MLGLIAAALASRRALADYSVPAALRLGVLAALVLRATRGGLPLADRTGRRYLHERGSCSSNPAASQVLT
jgi:hypothetical protein